MLDTSRKYDGMMVAYSGKNPFGKLECEKNPNVMNRIEVLQKKKRNWGKKDCLVVKERKRES